MAISQNFPTVRPTLSLNFARSKTLDPRITFVRNSIGTYLDRDGLIKTAGEDEARFDHDPATGESLGLLIEETRTNLITYSESFDQSYWQKFDNGLVQANQATSPDGTNTADKLYQTASGSTGHIVSAQISTTVGTVFTGSVFIKADTFNNPIFAINFRNSGGGSVGYFGRKIDLTNGSTSTGFSVPDSFLVTDFGNGWYKITVTQAAPANTVSVRLFIRLETTAANAAVFIWGAQLEEGGFPTSYIPTSGSTVTRSEDNASITGTNFSDFYNQDEGTVYVSQKLKAVPDIDRNNLVYLINGGSQIDFFYNVKKGYTNIFTFGDGGTNYSRFQNGTDSTDTKTAWAYDVSGDDFKAYYDGIEATNETTNNTPSATSHTQLELGSTASPASGTKYCGHIQQFIYYPTRLPNAQLQNLTK